MEILEATSEDENILNKNQSESIPLVLRKVLHPLIPELTSTQCDNIIKNKYKLSLPWPLYASLEELDEIDLCRKRVIASNEYQISLKRCQSFYNTSKKKKEYKKARKKNIQPYTVLKFAELLEQNPDPYFNANYDYYYTGGNLCTVKYGENPHILHVNGKNLNNLALSKLVKHNGKFILETLAQANLENNSTEIFNIVPSNQNNQQQSQIKCFTRQKNVITCLRQNDNILENYFQIESPNIPFISVTTAYNNDSSLIASNLSKTVALWDLNLSQKRPSQILWKSHKQEPITENWNHLQYLKRSVCSFIDLNNFYITDTRTPINNYEQYSILKNTSLSCENLSICQASKFNENCIYFGTTHKLFAIDIRYLNKNILKKNYLMSRWTHQMYLSPTILDTCINQEDEIILSSSLNFEDIRLYEQHKLGKFTFLPMPSFSTNDAYNLTKLKGECLDTSTIVASYIQRYKTGTCLISFDTNSNENPFVLQSRSSGDIFVQKLIPYSNHNDENFIFNEWELYENKLRLKYYKSPINITNIENLSALKKVFKCERLDLQPETNDEIIERPKRSQRWQRSISHLKKYKDALAQDLLSIWDFDLDDEFEKEKDFKYLTKIDESPSNNVHAWLSKTSNDQVLEADIVKSTNDNVNLNVSLDIFAEFNESISQTDDKNKTLENVLKKPKKSKRDIGF